MTDAREDIKARLDIVELVKEYIQVKPAGANFKANCPFHHEKSASLMVSPSKQIWHCFGCHQGGDIFSFYMKQEGIEFPEALRALAERAGVELERFAASREYADEKQKFLDIMSMATAYFQQSLESAPQAEAARKYVAGRGIGKDLIDLFRIGYALPDFDKLHMYLLSKNVKAQDLITVGLAGKKEQGYGLYDRFRDRIIIPITNVHGAVIGFGGRILTPQENAAKYLNSPQTPLYDKSKTLFGLDKAKNAIRKADKAVIVEGYMDVIASWKGGVENIVASSGTALTIEQIKLLKRFTPRFLFSFDTDAAGVAATMRGIQLALREGVDVRVIQLPKKDDGTPLYKDADECVQADPAIWKSSIEAAVPFMEFASQRLLPASALADPYEKKKGVHSLTSLIALIPDAVEQDHWVRELATRARVTESVLWAEVKQGKAIHSEEPRKTSVPVQTPLQDPTQEDDSDMRERLLLGIMLKFPSVIDEVSLYIKKEMLSSTAHRELYEQIISLYNATHEGKESYFLDKKDTLALPTQYIMYELLVDKEYGALEKSAFRPIADQIARTLKERYKKEQLAQLAQALHFAERAGDTKALGEYLARFTDLQKL